MENIARKFGLQINQEKTKYMMVERKNSFKKNEIGHLKIKNQKFVRVENFKYVGVMLKTFSLPTDAHNVKKHRVIKTF